MLAGPVLAQDLGETFRTRFGPFTVVGTFSKQTCQAQQTARSAQGQAVGFTVYWRPGRSLHLITQHPGYRAVQGNQPIRFVFPDGRAMDFDMTRNGSVLGTQIGFGSKAQQFYRLLEANQSLRIDMPAVNDSVQIDLAMRPELIRAMFFCRDEFLN
ncbi:hypothetical protein [Anianabacter salinae]|uniref:hypothetical protein n=1 Tax=Anianabacter salinae TaxID=2851023 RepID=UPI00225E52B8|nr:hypothetical protein [Anianabacter salinae]MBV0911876.1 hypothetical protein [Anianabacter salinae]